MYDNYCTLEEAWGKDYKKEEKRRRKRDASVRRETPTTPLLNDTVDDQILIAPPHEWAMSSPQEQGVKMDSTKPIISNLMSTNEIRPSMNRNQNNFHYPESRLGEIVNITKKEYENLKEMADKYISMGASAGGAVFQRTSETEQFNTLLLYIFTGIFLLITHDMMFQLGKKSY